MKNGNRVFSLFWIPIIGIVIAISMSSHLCAHPPGDGTWANTVGLTRDRNHYQRHYHGREDVVHRHYPVGTREIFSKAKAEGYRPIVSGGGSPTNPSWVYAEGPGFSREEEPKVKLPEVPETPQTPEVQPPVPESIHQIASEGGEQTHVQADTPPQSHPIETPPRQTLDTDVEKKGESPPPPPRVDILSVEFRENPDRLIVTLKNHMETPFVMCEGFGRFELRRSNGRLLDASNFRHVNLTFRKTTLPFLLPGETARLYLASFADYNVLIPLYHEENVQHYIHLCVEGYTPRQSLSLYYTVNSKLEKMDEHPERVLGAPRLVRPHLITTWGALKNVR